VMMKKVLLAAVEVYVVMSRVSGCIGSRRGWSRST
jgi:hypothetical protein